MADLKLKDIKLALSQATLTNIQKAIERRTKILGRVKTYESSAGTSQFARNSVFNAPVYDLAEIGRASDVEPYIMNSVRKHRTNILKEGFQLNGDNPKTVDYVHDRLFEIAMVTGIPTETWLREFITNVIMFHNGFLVFRRDATRSTGKRIKMYGKELDPIAGIFVMDPTSVEVEVDKYGTPVRWKQNVYGREVNTRTDKFFEPEDVLHVSIDRRTGFTFGTPYLVAVLDDIRALRKLEELALVLAEREAFPLYHYKVGTPERPALIYEDGSNEVDTVLSQLSSMPSQGYIITSERHDVTLISRDKSSMDLQPLLEYFESRVLGGLSLSPLDLGRADTSNKGTATNVSQNLQDSARDYQTTITAHLTHQLIVPLLLEGGFDVNLDNIVYFGFPLISKEEERAQQNHGLQMMMSNAITSDEFRKEYMNKKPLSESEHAGLMMNKELEGQVKLAKVAAKAKAAASPAKKSGTARMVANKAKPANQYGSKIKSRFKKNDSLSVDTYIESFKKTILSMTPETDAIEDAVNTAMVTFVRDCTTATSDELMDMIDSGFAVAKEQYQEMNPSFTDEIEPIGERSLTRFKTNFIAGSYWKVLNPHKAVIIKALTPDADGNTNSFMLVKNMEAIKTSVANLIRDQIDTSFRFGFIRFAKRMGYKNIELVDSVSKEVAEQIGIEDVIYKEFIPTPANIGCELRLPSGDPQ